MIAAPCRVIAASMRSISAMSSPSPTITLYFSVSKMRSRYIRRERRCNAPRLYLKLDGAIGGSLPFPTIGGITSAGENEYAEIWEAQAASDNAGRVGTEGSSSSGRRRPAGVGSAE